MKTAKLSTLLLLVLTSAFAAADPLTIPGPVTVTGSERVFGASASIQGFPAEAHVVGVWGRSQTVGVMGSSAKGSGVVGTATGGTGGLFADYGNGVALHALVPELLNAGGIALLVEGPMVKPRTAGNLMRFYDPKTGALVAELEFEVVFQPK